MRECGMKREGESMRHDEPDHEPDDEADDQHAPSREATQRTLCTHCAQTRMQSLTTPHLKPHEPSSNAEAHTLQEERTRTKALELEACEAALKERSDALLSAESVHKKKELEAAGKGVGQGDVQWFERQIKEV